MNVETAPASRAVAQHTPGTWIAVKADIDGSDPNRWSVCVDGERQFFIVTVENGAPGDTLDTEEANARLIASAPDLLAACERLLAYLINDNPGGFEADAYMAGLADNARAAIAKAQPNTARGALIDERVTKAAEEGGM